MKMKKILALTVLFVFLVSSVCLAYTPDPDRWYWIASDSEVGFFYDKKTIEYYDGGNTCDVWLMHVRPAEGKYVIGHEIYKKNRTRKILSIAIYSIKTDKLLGSIENPYPKYEDIIPGSFGETFYEILFYER